MHGGLSNVLCQGEGPEGSEEKVEPGGHGSGIIGNAPGDRDQSDAGSGPGREELPGERIDRGYPDEENSEEKKTKPEEVDAEELEDSSVDIGQATSVGVMEIRRTRAPVLLVLWAIGISYMGTHLKRGWNLDDEWKNGTPEFSGRCRQSCEARWKLIILSPRRSANSRCGGRSSSERQGVLWLYC